MFHFSYNECGNSFGKFHLNKLKIDIQNDSQNKFLDFRRYSFCQM